MTGKILGKIDFAEFGTIRDYPFLMGLQLGFKLADGCYVMDGGKYCVNVSPECKWEYEGKREECITKMVDHVASVIKDAGVNNVSGLVGKPVEVTIDRNTFVDFRILKEVL